MNRPRFESIGLCLPERSVASSDLVKALENHPPVDLEAITGIRSRRVRAADEDSYTFAVRAAADCLARSRYGPGDLDIVISASISRSKEATRYYDEPALSHSIKRAIGADGARHVDVSNACAGMFTGVSLLARLVRTGALRRGMVVSGEYITGIAETALREISEANDPQFASLTVGDSGAAVIIDGEGRDEGIELAEMLTVAEHADLCFGLPSDRRSGYAMYTKAKEIHDESISRWPRAVEALFARRGRSFDPRGYDFLITHQTSVKAIASFIAAGARHFGAAMPPELYSVVDYGNTASTTHFVALATKLREGVIGEGARVLMIANASGLVIGCLSVVLGRLGE